MGRRSLLVGLMLIVVMWPAPAHAVNDQNCEDFSSQQAAQQHLRDDPSDPDGLDGNDDDGRACETYQYPTGSPRDETPVQGAIGNGGAPAPLVSNTGTRRAPRVLIDGREYEARCGSNTLSVAGQGSQGAALTVNHTFTIDCSASASGLPRTGQMILQWTGVSLVLIVVGWMMWAGDRFVARRRRALHGRR